jgi:hypothetical protein
MFFSNLSIKVMIRFILLVSPRKISDISWVQSNVSVPYDTVSHNKWMLGFALPNIIMWALVFPIMFAYVLKNGSDRKKLDSIFFSQSWGYFYNEYSLKRYYWEIVKIFEKELIMIILIFY